MDIYIYTCVCTLNLLHIIITVIISSQITVSVQVEVCVMTPCSVVVGYQRFRGPYCFHLQGEWLS